LDDSRVSEGGIRGGKEDRSKEGTSAFLSYGQKISLRGVLYEPKERRNPGGFDYRAFLEEDLNL
jgi:predicted membrane metal-binding protein